MGKPLIFAFRSLAHFQGLYKKQSPQRYYFLLIFLRYFYRNAYKIRYFYKKMFIKSYFGGNLKKDAYKIAFLGVSYKKFL